MRAKRLPLNPADVVPVAKQLVEREMPKCRASVATRANLYACKNNARYYVYCDLTDYPRVPVCYQHALAANYGNLRVTKQ